MDIQSNKGFMRLQTVLELIPVSRAKFYKGIQSGEYPSPIKHGRMSLWRVEDIHTLIERINKEGV